MADTSNRVVREIVLPHPREAVWRALTDKDILAQWLHPNDFEPRLGHRFTIRMAPKPEVGFPGMTVQSEVLELDPPDTLVIAWNAAPPVAETRVTFRLVPEGAHGKHTRLHFEHAGFDLEHPFGKNARGGAEHGWSAMLDQLASVLSTS